MEDGDYSWVVLVGLQDSVWDGGELGDFCWRLGEMGLIRASGFGISLAQSDPLVHSDGCVATC